MTRPWPVRLKRERGDDAEVPPPSALTGPIEVLVRVGVHRRTRPSAVTIVAATRLSVVSPKRRPTVHDRRRARAGDAHRRARSAGTKQPAPGQRRV